MIKPSGTSKETLIRQIKQYGKEHEEISQKTLKYAVEEHISHFHENTRLPDVIYSDVFGAISLFWRIGKIHVNFSFLPEGEVDYYVWNTELVNSIFQGEIDGDGVLPTHLTNLLLSKTIQKEGK